MSVIHAKCTVCNHKETDKINQLLIIGTSTLKIAEKYNLCDRALRRHRKNHLPKLLIKAQALNDQDQADLLLEKVEEIQAAAWQVYKKAEREGVYGSAINALREARNCLELTGKLIGQLKSGHVINIYYDQRYIELKGVIFETLQKYPAARFELAEKLSLLEAKEGIEVEAEFEEVIEK